MAVAKKFRRNHGRLSVFDFLGVGHRVSGILAKFVAHLNELFQLLVTELAFSEIGDVPESRFIVVDDVFDLFVLNGRRALFRWWILTRGRRFFCAILWWRSHNHYSSFFEYGTAVWCSNNIKILACTAQNAVHKRSAYLGSSEKDPTTISR